MPLEPELIDHRAGRPDDGPPLDVADLRRLSRWMDNVFEIPGLRLRFGLDALLGLVPGFGDVASSVVALYILQAAVRLGVSRLTLARMGLNIFVDWLFGSLPLVGDAFDVYWKSNLRNVELLERHLDANPAAIRRERWSDWLFLGMLVVMLLAFLVGSLTMTYFTMRWLWAWLFPAAG